MKSVSNILCVASCVLILGAMATPAGAVATYDDFSTDPYLAAQWTEYGYYASDLVTPTWNSVDQDLDLVKVSGQGSVGLYRTGSTRTTTEPVTLTVKELSRTSGTWGFAGLMITSVPQQPYLTGGGDSYLLRMLAIDSTTVRPQVMRTYADGASNCVLYDGGDETFSGPYTLDIERVGNEYVFKANGAPLYTTGTAAGDFYTTAVKDSMVYYQIVTAGDGAMTATMDDFGVPGAPTPPPPPPLGDEYVVNVDVQGGSHAAYAGLGAAPDDSANTHWNLLNAANAHSDLSLTASDGANATPIGATLANWYSTYDAGTEGNTLQSDRIYDTHSPGDFTITGLESGELYDIYLYTTEGPCDYTINGVTKTATGGDAGGPPTWVEGQHYVLFEDVPGGADVLGTCSVPSGGTWSTLAGMQIAKNASAETVIPEPSTFAIWALGLLGLAFVARRRTR